jgi:hypothetical protein
MGLLNTSLLNTTNNDFTHYKQPSPFHRSLSNAVAPVNVHDESWRQLFELEYDLYPATADYQYWSTKSFDDAFIECQSEQGLADIFDEYLDGFYLGGDCC